MADTTGRRLILKDGTTIEDGEAGYAGGFLWLYFTGNTVSEATAVFSDPKKTGTIKFQYGTMEDIYDGYTDFRNIMTDADGNLSVCMTKP